MQINQNDEIEMDPSDLENYQKPLNYEKILSEIKASLIKNILNYYPDFYNLHESDPLQKTIEIAAYRELLIRQKIKDTINASLLNHSSGLHLKNLAKLILEKNEMENTDRRIKKNIYTIWHNTPYYTTGTKSAYEYFAKQAAAMEIREVEVLKNDDSEITIYILLNDQKLADNKKNEIIKKIETIIEDENIRRITDKINIKLAKIIFYTIKAKIIYKENYYLETVKETITCEVKKITNKLFGLAKTVSTNPLFKAFYTTGVKAVDLTLIQLAPSYLEPKPLIQANNGEALLWNGEIEFS